MGNVLQQINDAMTAIVERVRPGLVQISNGRGGRGAGTIWHPDGLIVTNAHVLHHAPPQITLADGHTLPARVVATDGNGDLAALAVATGGLPAIAHPAAWRLRPRHWVRALGHPWGITGAATAGMVIDVSPRQSCHTGGESSSRSACTCGLGIPAVRSSTDTAAW